MAKEIYPINCRTAEEAINVIDTIASSSSSFKIGKTGESVQDRGNKSDYQEYDYIQAIYATDSKENVSYWEGFFIDRYISHPNNDNKKDGGQSQNDEMADSGEYHLYVVWSE